MGLILLVLIVIAGGIPFWLRRLNRDYLVFYSFIVLLFAAVFSVSFLGLRVGGIVTVEKAIQQERDKAVEEIQKKTAASVLKIDEQIKSLREVIETSLYLSNDNNHRIGFGGLNKDSEALKEDRRRIIQTLKKIGSDEGRVREVIKPLNDQIVEELGYEEILHRVQRALPDMKRNGLLTDQQGTDIENGIIESLKINNYNAVKENLRKNNMYSKEIELGINRVKEFIANSENLSF